ncbi:hypothetical protein [Aurantiacibacter zhengii]|nr:hypothetical protein [Aurantiacibacter zhengii]
MSVSKFSAAEGEKLAWITPSMNVVVTVADVAAVLGSSTDEDFTGVS